MFLTWLFCIDKLKEKEEWIHVLKIKGILSILIAVANRSHTSLE